jgi:outer membrane biosynthesis protein TonB
VQGRVVIDAIIDDHGNVVELHVVSGQPLLVPAALQNVAQWKYEPTYLNGEPISVEMVVNVDFKLGQ